MTGSGSLTGSDGDSVFLVIVNATKHRFHSYRRLRQWFPVCLVNIHDPVRWTELQEFSDEGDE
jgi:hypothetical protein